MPARTKTSTTKLPQSLLEKINESSGHDQHHKNRLRGQHLSRKEARKQERSVQKQRRAEYFTGGAPGAKRAAEEEHHDSPKRKKIKLDAAASSAKLLPTNPPSVPVQQKPAKIKTTKKEPTRLEKLAAAPKPGVRVRTQKEKEEDAYIAYLESKLGYGKGSKKRMSAADDDGLDDLLDFTTSLASAPQDESLSEAVSSDVGSEAGDSEEMETEEEEEWLGIDQSDNDDDADAQPSTDSPALDPKPIAATRYIPPHLRNQTNEDPKNAENIIKLTRQLKGLLNRMSEQNIASIIESVEETYRNHRRNDVTSTLTTLIIDGISSHSSLLDSYVVLYAAFVSSLHKLVGIEFAAYFVQNVVSSYERFYNDLDKDTIDNPETPKEDTNSRGKECSNLIVLLSELYNFQVISCVLVFDVIRGLLNTITEFNVELLLKIVRNSGQQLRQDDPLALKDIIEIVHTKLHGQDDSLSSRTRFMVETLTNLKNSKLKRNVTQNQGGDAVERMKKFLTALGKKRQVLAHEPLLVSLEDLHSANTKGKWWLVGAAWGGDPLVDRQENDAGAKKPERTTNVETDALLKLARKQGMNTDIRRSIFVVLMSSDDYVDACERLSQLSLTEVQQREIVRVLLHCCGNEKSYNPYYIMVAQHLCRTSHSYKITLQFCLWDFLRDLGENHVGGVEVIKNLKDTGDDFDVTSISSTRMRNVAKAYGWWISKDCVTLAILKPLDFTILKTRTREFLKEMFTQLFINSQVSTPTLSSNPKDLPTSRDRAAVEEIFMKAKRIPNLPLGLVYFLGEAFRENSSIDGGELVKWANGIAMDTLRG